MSENPPLPPFATWSSFPFDGDLKLKPLDELVEPEPPRHGENPMECLACNSPDAAYIWVSERWRVRSLEQPTGLPVVLILEPRSHLDLGDLPNLLAAELGIMTVRVERAIRSLDGVARVHVNRWGDGASHLHLWFLARPYGRLQLRGSFLSMWNDILPPVAEEPWRENLALVAAWLAEFDGTALAEPPRIHWTAPSRFAPETPAEEPAETTEGVNGTAGDVGPADSPSADSPSAGTASTEAEQAAPEVDTTRVEESAANGGRPAPVPSDAPAVETVADADGQKSS